MALAALLTRLNAPLELAEIGFGGCDFGQVRVRMLAAGICGAQLQEIRGEKGGPLPHTMGHEGVGIVEQTGDGVTRVQPGDKVVLHWRKGAGIESDNPQFSIVLPSIGGTVEMQTYTTGRCTTWAEEVVVSENRCTPVPQATPNELAVLLGCGLSTALGTMENEVAIRPGQSVLVVGCGGLGANLIRAARFFHAGRVVACDCAPGKDKFAKLLGVDAFVTSPAKVREKFDVVVETSGNPDAIGAAITQLAPSGRAVLVGQPPPGSDVTLPLARHLFDGEGKSIRATQGGGHDPSRDIPRYVRLWQSGALKLDGIITHRVPLSKINSAVELVKRGEAGRVMVEISKS